MLSQSLLVNDSNALCIEADRYHAAILAKGGTWVTLSRDQWEFMRGVYVQHPKTPDGLPLGDSAVMAHVPGDTGAMIFFIDGSLACTPMAVPSDLIDMLADIAANTQHHEPTL